MVQKRIKGGFRDQERGIREMGRRNLSFSLPLAHHPILLRFPSTQSISSFRCYPVAHAEYLDFATLKFVVHVSGQEPNCISYFPHCCSLFLRSCIPRVFNCMHAPNYVRSTFGKCNHQIQDIKNIALFQTHQEVFHNHGFAKLIESIQQNTSSG